MNLAAILGFLCILLSPMWANAWAGKIAAVQSTTESQSQASPKQDAASGTQAQPAQDAGSTQGTAAASSSANSSPTTSSSTSTSSSSKSSSSATTSGKQTTSAPKIRRKKPLASKKNLVTDCAAQGNAGAKPSPGTDAAAEPCPPPKKVVRNGSAAEPEIQLLGGTTDQQAANERSTEQLTAATEDNLKKIAGRQLSASAQESVGQIKQYMEQSKQAVAAGDAERAHNLAQKARLLSDQLVKP
jgi:hypothetical protein